MKMNNIEPIDGHIHIEKQPYSLELIELMVTEAKKKHIEKLCILDHSHKFKEFRFLYQPVTEPNAVNGLNRHLDHDLQEYIDFIHLVKEKSWPIKLEFGLEICYFKETESSLRDFLSQYDCFDFLVGSVHFTDGVAIDQYKEVLEKMDIDKLTIDYYLNVERCIKSKLFTYIGHPDLIKLFQLNTTFSLIPIYERVASVFNEYHQETENNTGSIRHGFPYPGLNPEFYQILKKHHVKIHKSSDAHVYQDIGRVFDQIEDNLI